MNGFRLFNSRENTVEHNIITYRNIISPFSNTANIVAAKANGEVFVDENYGFVYDDYYLKGQTSIYGELNLLPPYSGDHLANYGFLRVPFRKIPRVWIDNKQQLMNIVASIQSDDPNIVVLYRGQFQEHHLSRDKQTLLNIYGDENALEPSLVTSAARKNMKLEDILPSWMGILNLYIENIMDELPDAELQRVQRKIANFQSNSNFNLFALAMAQHYGLPSVGLDVTPDLDVALFFALKKFISTETHPNYIYQHIQDIKPAEPPVIYLIAPAEAMQLNYFDFKPSVLPFLRPDKQSARFMHTGWGLNKNFAATRIFMALYLNPEGDFGVIKDAKELFPANDSFADMINFIRLNQKHQDDLLSEFLKTFYIIK